MLYINTCGRKILNVDQRFQELLAKGVTFEKDVYTSIMEEIDRVSVREGNTMETPFGRTTLDHLSSGCKAIMLSVFYHDRKSYVVNIDQCGDNAIAYLFKISKQYDLYVYTSRGIAVYEEDAECYIDGEYYSGGMYIYEKLC